MRTVPSVFRLSPVAAGLALALAPSAAPAATWTVSSGLDSGPGTLREAINFANTVCASDGNPLIVFDTEGGPFVISLATPLPMLRCNFNSLNAVVDGYASPSTASANTLAEGWDADIQVTIDGSSLGAACGLELQRAFSYGGELTVRGIDFRNFTTGTAVCGTSVRANVFGSYFSNNHTGVYTGDYGSAIGGESNADRNVFVGNTTGIYGAGGGTYVENNFIGTYDGYQAEGNVTGIHLPTDYGEVRNNVISGNTGVGLLIEEDYGGAIVTGNLIGLTADGLSGLGNGGGGILVRDSDGTQIENNYIAGNSVAGIAIDFSEQIRIEGNTMGLAVNDAVTPNTRGIDVNCANQLDISDNLIAVSQFEGMFLSGVSDSSIVTNTVLENNTTGIRLDLGTCYGGQNYLGSNYIHNNGADGILLMGGTTGNHLSQNLVYANGRKNINLNNTAAPLPNDAGDLDGGNNNQQNYPVVDSVVQGGVNTEIGFTLSSQPGEYVVQFFANDTAGNPAGKSYLGSATVTVYGGPVTATFTAYGTVDHISATATSASTIETSEFSLQKAATSAPAVSLSPASLNFTNQLVGTTSADRLVLVRSLGDAPYVISSFCYGGLDATTGKLVVSPVPSLCTGGAFTCESTCVPGQPYTKNQTCRITASFSPGSLGSYSDELFLCDNSATGLTTLNLSGVAIPPPPITISPRDYDFGGIPVGNVSDSARFEVRNTSYGAINLAEVRTTGEFDVLDTNCPPVLYGGAFCEANVVFGPTQAGDAVGTFEVAYDGSRKDAAPGVRAAAPLSVASSNLTGVGLAGGQLALPGPIELGAAPVGGAAITRSVELRNTGTQPVNVASVTVSAPFTLLSNTCTGAPIPPGGGCALVIGFTATAPGGVSGLLTIVSDASGGSGEVSVHATGQVIAAPLVVATPTSIGFGDRTIGTQTSGRSVSITNIGGVTANLSLAVSSIDFLLGGTSCGATLAPQASCAAEVAFRPVLGFGARTGALVITSNSSNSPLSVILGGTSCRPYVGIGSRTGTSSNCAP